MKVTLQGIKDVAAFAQAQVELPKYDVAQVQAHSKENPVWLHFGAGNIFRGFVASLQQDLLNKGLQSSGIQTLSVYDGAIIDDVFTPHDKLTMEVTLLPDTNVELRVIGSVVHGYKLNGTALEDEQEVRQLMTKSSLQMVSYTITEKGYAIRGIDGQYLPQIVSDIEKGPKSVGHAMSWTASLLWDRYQAGALPIAMVSMDNCSHNGEKLQNSILTMAKEWLAKGFVEEGFVEYLSNEKQVSFPWSMIDKITPRPADSVCEDLEKAGVEEIAPVITSKRTYIAPFVNAEGPQYLVIEDKFPNGRPALEKAGVYLTDRDTVNKVERMKVTTCLNPLHTALAVYGCVLGYTLIADEMKDEQLNKLVHQIGPVEGMPVVTDPGILSPADFVDEVINVRIPNPFMPDTPQRIATDTSQKVGIRYGETIKSYVAQYGDAKKLTAIPLAIAGWCRYLLGVDDEGNTFERSADPMLEELSKALEGIEVGNPSSYNGQLKSILSNANIFGIDLYEAGIGEKIESMFLEEIAGAGAVRNTLKKYMA